MSFTSSYFAFFLVIVFVFYWFLTSKSLRIQNALLLVSSYFFYACWDWRFLFLLVFSTLLDYFTGLKISSSTNAGERRFWFWFSITVNLGFLAVFKYYDFFALSFAESIAHFGYKIDPWTLNLILPVGISFYTFHGLSYVIDVYKNRILPERDFVDYSVFVSFFPLLVAGPIERATHLLPQIKQRRVFDYTKAVDGLRQILWGLFKKLVIADSCAKYANLIFGNPTQYSSSELILGAVCFAFQIYGDFSGYSDIALGTARLFGIELLKNFSFPYFSRDIAEFWRRWHISLSSWFKDYLYIPLGGSKGGTWLKIRNTFIIFIVSGFWHGANWTFVVWGALNAVYFIPLLLMGKNRTNLDIVAKGKFFPTIRELLAIGVTFGLTVFAWIFFRSTSIENAFIYIDCIFSESIFHLPPLWPIGLISFFVLIEWFGRENNYAIEKLGLTWYRPIRLTMYYLMIIASVYYGSAANQFIYFQF